MGRIELIIGCMYSGKTTELIRQIHRFQTLKKKIYVVTHESDTRYDERGMVCSHDHKRWQGKPLSSLSQALSDPVLQKSDIVFVEEGHFFPDLSGMVLHLANVMDKTVIVCGLDGDFEAKPFEEITTLIPHAEKLIKLNALCTRCNDGTEASFSRRMVESKAKQLVGSFGVYEAVCRKHFYA